MQRRAAVACLSLSSACGSPAPTDVSSPPPPPPSSASVVAAASAPPAPAPPSLPDDVVASELSPGAKVVCNVHGALPVSVRELAASPGGKTYAWVRGKTKAHVSVLEGGGLFGEFDVGGVVVRGFVAEPTLVLGKPHTFGGVWSRRGVTVRPTGAEAKVVHATLEPKAFNIELLGGATDTVDLSCDHLALAFTPPTEATPPAKRVAWARAKTKLDIAETESGKPTVRWTIDDGGTVAVDVLEEHGGRVKIRWSSPTEEIVGWVKASALVRTLPKVDTTRAAAKLAADADKMQLQTLGALTSSGSPSDVLAKDPTDTAPAPCAFRLLADVDGKLVHVGIIGKGAHVKLGEASGVVRAVSLKGITFAGDAEVPRRDEAACGR